MTDGKTPLAGLLARAGGVRGLVYTSLPVTTFAAANAVLFTASVLIRRPLVGVGWAWVTGRDDTDQEGLLAAARIAMGWPIFMLTSTLIYLAIRTAIRALPRAVEAG